MACNIPDFADKYLRGCIGEMIFSARGYSNGPALYFLRRLLSAAREKARRDGKTELEQFCRSFLECNYAGGIPGDFDTQEAAEFDYEGGRIGIVHTSIELAEGD